jgi:hypothetical protein
MVIDPLMALLLLKSRRRDDGWPAPWQPVKMIIRCDDAAGQAWASMVATAARNPNSLWMTIGRPAMITVVERYANGIDSTLAF